MRLRGPTNRCRGFVDVDILVGVVLVMLLAALTAEAIFQYRHTRDQYVWRQAAMWAAEAQVKRYQAGVPLGTPPPAGVVAEEITLDTAAVPGTGQWKGFDLVTVTAVATMPSGRTAREQLSAYVRTGAKP